MAMLDNAKKSAESEPVENAPTTETPAESKSDAEENFEEFTPATETENNQ
jgi:hypothetical protein